MSRGHRLAETTSQRLAQANIHRDKRYNNQAKQDEPGFNQPAGKGICFHAPTLIRRTLQGLIEKLELVID
jgi:hypothetical protein